MSQQTNNPLVTVVVVPRESFNDFTMVVQRIFDVTSPIFKMLIMEGHAPKNYSKELYAIQQKYSDRCKIVTSDRWKFPHEFVNDSLALIDTKYACFIDNDVEVLEGWLENLVKTAEEKKADCIHPIYLTVKLSDPKRTIHIAEGQWFKEKRGDKWFIDTIATYSGVELKDYPHKEARRSDFFEWHCVMFSKELLNKIGPLEDMNVAEHMDYALMIEKAGYPIWIEPKAVVAYDYARIWRLRGADRKYLLFRWNLEKAKASHQILAKKWNLDPECYLRRENFLEEHSEKVKSMNLVTRTINKIRRIFGMGNMPLKLKPMPKTASHLAFEKHLAEVKKGHGTDL